MGESAIVETSTTAAMALEHRLTLIEGSIAAGFDKGDIARDAGFKAMAQAVERLEGVVLKQNSRIGKLESWKQTLETAQAYAKGAVEGAQTMGRGQLALLAIVGPLLFTGIGLALQHWG